jgi:hypothetical protein
MYSMVTPMPDPFTYSLRNKDIKMDLRMLFEKATVKIIIVCVLKSVLIIGHDVSEEEIKIFWFQFFSGVCFSLISTSL